ncbi:MAG: AI-2E family transporter [Gracilimonas sp.]|nr:AI-2E family transporter [Gracilimonas sp.]
MPNNFLHHPTASQKKHPFWFKSTMILIGLSLLVIVLTSAKFILMPLAFSAFLAMLLNPLVKVFEKLKMGKVLSIILSLIAVIIVLAGILSLISVQFAQFAERVPEVTEKLKALSAQAIGLLEEQLGLSQEEQSKYLEQGVNNLIDQSGNLVSSVVSATTNMFTVLGLMPIFIFFMLYYQEMYRTFFQKLFAAKRGDYSHVDNLLNRIQEVTQNYLVGMLTVIGILAMLNTTGLFIIGLEHALFFGVFASLLAIIPYIGIIIGAFPPLLFALLLTDSLLTPLFVVIVFATVQFLEGNFITPKIVGSKVSINPFVAMVALIVGGQLWGISGMILFVPLIGILKVIFDQMPELKPYGYLLGNSIEYNKD